MGAQPSVPRPGVEFQVIGAGLSRTATASFSEALKILLDGPVYHGGTQTTTGPSVEMRSWIKALSHFPPHSTEDSKIIHSVIKDRLSGYVAITDAPGSGLVPELLEVYSNAMVICTVRDPDSWVKSMEGVASASTKGFLRVVLYPLPQMRYFVDYINVLRNQWVHLYHEQEPCTTKTYHGHIEWLRRTVPKEQLMFYDVRDGWAPLCKALGKEVPDIPFPRINDSEAIDRFAKKALVRGLVRWALIVATGGLALLYFRLTDEQGRKAGGVW